MVAFIEGFRKAHAFHHEMYHFVMIARKKVQNIETLISSSGCYAWADRSEDCNTRAMIIEWALPIHVLCYTYYASIGYIRLITRVSVRYGEIFHEPKASEISRHISQRTSVLSAL